MAPALSLIDRSPMWHEKPLKPAFHRPPCAPSLDTQSSLLGPRSHSAKVISGPQRLRCTRQDRVGGPWLSWSSTSFGRLASRPPWPRLPLFAVDLKGQLTSQRAHRLLSTGSSLAWSAFSPQRIDRGVTSRPLEAVRSRRPRDHRPFAAHEDLLNHLTA